jgi:hypothetical protein
MESFSNIFSKLTFIGQVIFWMFATLFGELYRLSRIYFQQFRYTFTITVILVASQLDVSAALASTSLLSYGDLFSLFYVEIMLLSLIFFGFFYYFYAYEDKEKRVLAYLQHLMYSFVLYAFLVFVVYSLNGGAAQAIPLHFLFFKGAV